MTPPMTPIQEKYFRMGFSACEQIIAGMELLPYPMRHKIVTACRNAERQRTQYTDFEKHNALLDSRTTLATHEVVAAENQSTASAVLVVNRGGR